MDDFNLRYDGCGPLAAHTVIVSTPTGRGINSAKAEFVEVNPEDELIALRGSSERADGKVGYGNGAATEVSPVGISKVATSRTESSARTSKNGNNVPLHAHKKPPPVHGGGSSALPRSRWLSRLRYRESSLRQRSSASFLRSTRAATCSSSPLTYSAAPAKYSLSSWASRSSCWRRSSSASCSSARS